MRWHVWMMTALVDGGGHLRKESYRGDQVKEAKEGVTRMREDFLDAFNDTNMDLDMRAAKATSFFSDDASLKNRDGFFLGQKEIQPAFRKFFENGAWDLKILEPKLRFAYERMVVAKDERYTLTGKDGISLHGEVVKAVFEKREDERWEITTLVLSGPFEGKPKWEDIPAPAGDSPAGYVLREGQCAHEILQWDVLTPGTIETLQNMTKEECAELCDGTPDCYSFETYRDYGSTGVHDGFPVAEPGLCQITRQYQAQCEAIDKFHLTCPGRTYNVDLYVKQNESPLGRYTHKSTMCGGDGDIIRYTKSFSFDDCAQKCDAEDKCTSFHYYPGKGDMKWVGKCLLTTQTLKQWCNPHEKKCKRKSTPNLYLLSDNSGECDVDEKLDPTLLNAMKEKEEWLAKEGRLTKKEYKLLKAKKQMGKKHSKNHRHMKPRNEYYRNFKTYIDHPLPQERGVYGAEKKKDHEIMV